MADASNKPHKPEPCCFVIFGVTGDLTHRLVIPALYNLAESDLLPEQFCIVGIVRKEMSEDDLRQSLMEGLNKHADAARQKGSRPKVASLPDVSRSRSIRSGLVRYLEQGF